MFIQTNNHKNANDGVPGYNEYSEIHTKVLHSSIMSTNHGRASNGTKTTHHINSAENRTATIKLKFLTICSTCAY